MATWPPLGLGPSHYSIIKRDRYASELHSPLFFPNPNPLWETNVVQNEFAIVC